MAVQAQLVLNDFTASTLQQSVQLADAAIAKLRDHTPTNDALTVQDFEAVGITGVDAFNLEFVVAALHAQTNTAAKDGMPELNGIANQGIAQYQALLTSDVRTYANDDSTTWTDTGAAIDWFNATSTSVGITRYNQLVDGINASTNPSNGATLAGSAQVLQAKVAGDTQVYAFDHVRLNFNSDAVENLPDQLVVRGERTTDAGNTLWETVAVLERGTSGVIPTFTSNTNGTMTVSASGTAGAGYEAFRAVDGVNASTSNNTNSWAHTKDATNGNWWQIDLGAPKLIWGLDLKGLPVDGRMPSSFKVQGFDEATQTWVNLDNQQRDVATTDSLAAQIELNGSYKLDKSQSDFITLPSMKLSGGFSLQMWMNLDGETPSLYSRLFDIGAGQGSTNLLVYIDSSKRLGFAVYNGANVGVVSSSNDAIKIDGWHQYSVTVSDSGYAKIYVDGAVVGQGQLSQQAQDVVRANAYIGRSNWNNDPYLEAYVGEIRVWDRELQVEEVQSSLTAPLTGNEIGLQAYIPAYQGSLANLANNSVADATASTNTAFVTDVNDWAHLDQRSFVLENPGYYQKYRVQIEGNQGDSFVGLDGVQMYAYSTNVLSDVGYSAFSVTTDGAPSKLAELNVRVVPTSGTSQATTLAELDTLNIANVVPANALNYRGAIAAKAGTNFVVGQDVQSLVDSVNTAVAKVLAAVQSNTEHTLTSADFTAAGLPGIDTALAARLVTVLARTDAQTTVLTGETLFARAERLVAGFIEPC